MGMEAWSVIGTGVALLGAGTVAYRSLHGGMQEIRRDLAGLHRDLADLRERMARLEGLFHGFTRREPAAEGG